MAATKRGCDGRPKTFCVTKVARIATVVNVRFAREIIVYPVWKDAQCQVDVSLVMRRVEMAVYALQL